MPIEKKANTYFVFITCWLSMSYGYHRNSKVLDCNSVREKYKYA